MTTHTPGPWGYEATPESSYWDWKVTFPKKNSRAPYIGIDTNAAKADAQLIAAAPDLLAACRKSVVLLAYLIQKGTVDCEKEYEAVSAAIAKATGGAP